MSSPVVERVRTIPLIIERDVPMEHDEINTGYPFDRDDTDRDGYLRSQLDDIAKRHPEIAEHLENFTQRDRPRSQQSNDGAGSPRRFPRQFGDRFERFGFPFDRDDFDPEYYKEFQQPNQEFRQPFTKQHSATYHHPPPPEQNQAGCSQTPSQSGYTPSSPNQSCPPEPERCNLQQSSTFDLGQKQEPVNDRSQRSMSAPPSENSPLNQSQQSENMSHSQQHSETKSSNERIIPIHIEGRDEPVLPKNIPPSYSQQQHHAGPQPDRLFGKPTEHFTQFLPHDREPRWSQGFTQEEPVRQQRFHPQQRKPQEYVPSQPKGEIPIPVQREVPITKTHQQPQQQKPPQQQQKPQQRTASPAPQEQKKATPPPQTKPLSPLEQIQAIQKDVSSLVEQVEAFTGKMKDKQYLYLDEMLTRNLIKLDNIDTQGQETIRSARKEAIRSIEKTISILEAKAGGGIKAPEESEVVNEDVEPEEAPKQEEEKTQKEGEVVKDSEVPPENCKEMEVDEKPVEEKVPESSTTSEPNNLEPMEVETSQNIPASEASADKMETTDEPPSSNLTTSSEGKKEEKTEINDESKPSDSKEVPEEKKQESAVTDKKEEQAMAVENVPEMETVAEKQTTETENTNEDVTSDNIKTDENTESDSKEKKDKKKGKKKVEKKDK